MNFDIDDPAVPQSLKNLVKPKRKPKAISLLPECLEMVDKLEYRLNYENGEYTLSFEQNKRGSNGYRTVYLSNTYESVTKNSREKLKFTLRQLHAKLKELTRYHG